MDSNVEPETRILSIKLSKGPLVEMIAVYGLLAEAAATLRYLGQTSKAKLVESTIRPDHESHPSKIPDMGSDTKLFNFISRLNAQGALRMYLKSKIGE